MRACVRVRALKHCVEGPGTKKVITVNSIKCVTSLVEAKLVLVAVVVVVVAVVVEPYVAVHGWGLL